MQRVETFSVLYKDREKDRMKVREQREKKRNEIEKEREGKNEEEMNLDVLIQDRKTEWGEMDEGRKEDEVREVESGVRPRFLEPFNDIPEENE